MKRQDENRYVAKDDALIIAQVWRGYQSIFRSVVKVSVLSFSGC